ncbi:MAG: 2-octaprenyl-6-methoxyphenol hydroxylase [Rickettsiales bacterium]|jgi:2-octaprenyl-6-methoxyphenol hydroxylase
MNNKFDIIIIGGGFSGLTAALYLAKSNPNIQIALLEKYDILKQDKKRDGRSFAISKSSLEVFYKNGITKSIEENAGTIKKIKIVDGDSPFYLNFDADHDSSKNSTSEKFGLVVENFHIHNALRDEVLKQNNIEIICPNFYEEITFENNQASVTLDDKRLIKSKLILACDGRFSDLRDKFDIKTFKKSYEQTALVFNISHSLAHQNIALEKFLPDGPFAVLPMKNDLESSIVWTLRKEKAETIFQMDEENFLHQLKKSTGDYLGEIKLLNKPFKYNLDLIVADKFYHQRLILIGDAAHGIHPIAGQGFNLGVDDIRVLNDLVKESLECGLDIGSETLLQKYNKIRKIDIYKMVAATDGLNGLFSNNSKTLKALRNSGLGIVEKIPSLKKFFIKNAGGN